jgi:hypothetical protein
VLAGEDPIISGLDFTVTPAAQERGGGQAAESGTEEPAANRQGAQM